MLDKLEKELLAAQDKERASKSSRFFKTGKGEYGEGDAFLGISVPKQRKISKKYQLSLEQIQELLDSKYHEFRFVGLLQLIDKYQKTRGKELVEFYLENTNRVNNWDLVDVSAHKILGDYLLDKDKKILYKLAKGHLWERRIAIISTLAFIKTCDFRDTLQLSELLLRDKRDLIHKAVGWMLREVGKKNRKVEERFLDQHCTEMPRTMLRYAIEKFPEKRRQYYLNK